MKTFTFKNVRFSVPKSVGTEIIGQKVLLATELSYVTVTIQNGIESIKIVEQPDGDDTFTSFDRAGKVCFNGLKVRWTHNTLSLKFYDNIYAQAMTI